MCTANGMYDYIYRVFMSGLLSLAQNVYETPKYIRKCDEY